MTCVQCEDLSVGYEQHPVAAHISFSLDTGGYLCIVGENGAGKSTLIKTLLGLQKPLAGTIRYGEGFCRGSIGYLPQQSAIQKDFPATVEEVVRSGLVAQAGWCPFLRTAHKERARAAMAQTGVAALARRSYRELSGGQQQRVLLARALCATSSVLLLDEPVAGLDPLAAAELYAHIQALNTSGLSIIMITHDSLPVRQYASHVLYLGREPFFGTRADFLQGSGGALFTTGNREEAAWKLS